MSEVCAPSPGIEMRGDAPPDVESGGTLKTPSGDFEILVLVSEDVSAEALEFLSQINQPQTSDTFNFEAVWITGALMEVEQMIGDMLSKLAEKPDANPQTPDNKPSISENPLLQSPRSDPQKTLPPSSPKTSETPPPAKVYSSLFSLARDVNTKSFAHTKAEAHSQAAPPSYSLPPFQEPTAETKESFEREGDGKRDDSSDEEGKEGSDQHQKKQQMQKVLKKKDVRVQAASGVGASKGAKKGSDHLAEVDNIFIQFMALMARILSQSEAEAHALYQKIKARTDDIDTLTQLIGKINNSGGKIDWSDDEEMKKLVDKAREIGVAIPEGKYTWTEDEKKLLKENIQMQKDSMEKVTQLERTDMQRFLQESSQCHQARSNVLKLLKEVIDTIIHNMRP